MNNERKVIMIRGSYEEIMKQVESLKRKYGKDTPIIDFIEDPFLWTNN